MDSIIKEVAKNISFYRKRAKLTQKQFAEKLEVKNTAVSNWENAKNGMDVDTLFKICEVLNVSVSDIYGVNKKETTSLSTIDNEIVSLVSKMNDESKRQAIDYLKFLADKE